MLKANMNLQARIQWTTLPSISRSSIVRRTIIAPGESNQMRRQRGHSVISCVKAEICAIKDGHANVISSRVFRPTFLENNVGSHLLPHQRIESTKSHGEYIISWGSGWCLLSPAR